MASTLIIPQDADELREMLTDTKVIRQLQADPALFAQFTTAAINARLKNDPGILAQVNEQVESFKIDWLKEHQGNTDALAARLNLAAPLHGTRSAYNKAAPGARFDKTFNSLSDYMVGITDQAFKDESLSRKLHGLQDALSSVRPSDGGFLIPEDLRAELLRISVERSIVRSRARVIPMDSLTMSFPGVDSTSNVSSVYGGVTGFWTEEGATLTESAPRFMRVMLQAHKLCLYTEIPNELIRDSRPALDVFINTMFPEAMSWFEDIAFFIGSGVGEPLGFRNAPATVLPTRSTTVAGANIEWVDIVNMYSRMLPSSLDNAVWVINQSALPSLLTMTVGSGNQAVWIGGGTRVDGSSAPPMSMLGRPLIVTEKTNTVGHQGDINFVDFGYYLIGDRQTISARQSEDYKFQSDVTAIRMTSRLDGRPWLQDAITPYDGGDTLSPFVGLATHA